LIDAHAATVLAARAINPVVVVVANAGCASAISGHAAVWFVFGGQVGAAEGA
jgi:hypothetical protein